MDAAPPRRAALSRRDWYLLTNSIVLAWIVLALVAVGVHRFVDQPLWLLVHVPLLGAATAAILIWSQHFADTLLRRSAPGGRAGLGTRLALHTLGAGVVMAGMLTATIPLVAIGGGVVAAAVVAHGIILGLQTRTALPARFAPLVRYYVAAAAVFFLGIAAGVVTAIRPVLADRLVTTHLILNAYGWIGLTVLGTLVLLWPTILHARMPRTADAAARHALPVLVAGLVVAATGPIVDLRPLVALGMALWIAGAGRLAVEGWREARAMPPATYAGWSLAAGFAWVVAAAAALGIQSLVVPDWATLRVEYLVVLGPLVVGFVVQVLTGALSHLLPVVALGSPAAAKAGSEVLDRGAAFRVAAFNGAILLYLAPMPSLARVLLSFVVAGLVVTFVVLAVRALVVGRRIRRAEGPHPDRSGRVTIGMPLPAPPSPPRRRPGAVVAALGLLALCVGAGVAVDPAAAGISTVAPSQGVVATGETTAVTVRVDGMRFDPAVIEVPYGDRLVVTFENTGTDVHDLTFANGVRTGRLAPGASEKIDVGLVGADFQGWCSIAGHRQMGMELTVEVTGAPAVDDSHAAGHEHDAGSAGAAADVDLQREPASSFAAWPAALVPASDETVHRVTLNVEEIVTDVAPGVSQARWTFGGRAPGPVLRGRVGDRFEITLVNDGTIGHSIDFHAGALAPDGPMRTIQPGETLTYAFTATQAGIWMYHCSTMPMSMHIANGMHGAVIIDPPDLAPVDREYVLVQGELYLGAAGATADADKIAAGTPDLVAFNGYADQYVHRPLSAAAGERVRVWVLDAGPNAPSSFHVVGGQFDTVYVEGSYVLQAGDPGGSQAMALQPAQGGFVELTFPEPGSYPFVTHRMSDAEKGARGLFRVE
ncbi:multicopper oxidase domain-containing protein [Microbacterium sp. NPDC019599]|uniref:multicopper oxidase domain-containing protein n=1 Tax=Microbacterium sp. NPDC019599 TaxID=3154690 RepID=UPI0033CD2FD5